MKECDLRINPSYALGFTGIRLPLENTLVTLQRLHSLAFGFETFAFRQNTKLSCLSTVFQGQPDIGSNEISGIINNSIIVTAAANYYYYYYYRGSPP
jgi:hypothetical protein